MQFDIVRKNSDGPPLVTSNSTKTNRKKNTNKRRKNVIRVISEDSIKHDDGLNYDMSDYRKKVNRKNINCEVMKQ